MQSVGRSVLSYMRVPVSVRGRFVSEDWSRMCFNLRLIRNCSTNTNSNHDEVLDRVLGLVKNFDKVDPSKVTEKAHFQNDLSLDSLDRVELVMALEEEFSVEIPEAEADKLKCCVDVARYIASQPTDNSTSS